MREPRETQAKTMCPVCGSAFSRVLPRKLSKDEQAREDYIRYRRCADCHAEYRSAEKTLDIVRSSSSTAA